MDININYSRSCRFDCLQTNYRYNQGVQMKILGYIVYSLFLIGMVGFSLYNADKYGGNY